MKTVITLKPETSVSSPARLKMSPESKKLLTRKVDLQRVFSWAQGSGFEDFNKLMSDYSDGGEDAPSTDEVVARLADELGAR